MKKYMDINLPFDELMSREKLLDSLEDDPTDNGLSKIREDYTSRFGRDLFWRYPISDGIHAGLILVPVREGFLSLPYDEIDAQDYEIYKLDNAIALNSETISRLAQDFKSYADSLLCAMEDARLICLEKEINTSLPMTVHLSWPPGDHSLTTLYETIFRELGYEKEPALRYDCTYVDVSRDIMEWLYAQWEKAGASDFDCGALWAMSGPKVDDSLSAFSARVQPGFVSFSQYDKEGAQRS